MPVLLQLCSSGTPPRSTRSITVSASVCNSTWSRRSSRGRCTSRCCWKAACSRSLHPVTCSTASQKSSSTGKKKNKENYRGSRLSTVSICQTRERGTHIMINPVWLPPSARTNATPFPLPHMPPPMPNAPSVLTSTVSSHKGLFSLLHFP